MQQPVSVRKKRWYHSQISNQPVPSPMLPQFVNGAGGTGHPQSLVRENDMKPDPGLEASPTLTTPCLDCKTSDAHKSASALARKMKLPETLQWIPENWTWSKIKPVIRCAVAAWIATVLFVIPRVQIFLGQASFLIVMVPFLSPPSDPLLAVVEREIITLLFVTLAWAWSCLGMMLADKARTQHDLGATLPSAITGRYIEAGPTIIIAAFIFCGSVFFSYVRARQGIGPYYFGCFLGCLCLDVCLTTAVFFPFPFYTVGRTIVLPVTLFSAVALLVSITIFPSTISAQFTTRLQGVLSPLVESFELHRRVLKSVPHTEHFSEMVASIKTLTGRSEATLASLAAAGRLLDSDLIYARFSPEDFHSFQNQARRITARASGMETYFMLIDPIRERFPISPGPSVPETPLISMPATPNPIHAVPTLEQTIELQADSMDNRLENDLSISQPRRPALHASSSQEPHSPSILYRRSHGTQSPRFNMPRHLPHNILHRKLLQVSNSRKENVVGIFESQRYLNLEASTFRDPDAQAHTTQATALLSNSCDDLLGTCITAITAVRDWLGRVRRGRFDILTPMKEKEAQWEKELAGLRHIRDELFSELKNFRKEKRHRITNPYRTAFEPKVNSDADLGPPGHRYLFHCYTYQHHLIQAASIIIEMLDDAINLETKRRKNFIWTPIRRIFRWDIWEMPEDVEHDDDENPDIIQGLSSEVMADLGMPRRRDPDALPPRNSVESFMNLLYHGLSSLGRGNVLFALKAATLTVMLCMPFFLKSSASFAYRNRMVWAIFMGQLTLARFRGDTAFGLISRILSTFAGGLIGMVMWYLASGSGSGNPYSLAVVCGICYPFFFYARIYWPGPFMVNMVFFFTVNLVLGYSWQDSHIPFPGSPGFGFSVAWRRFVLVTAGVVAAFVASFLPPSTTIRHYQRTALATTSEEIGSIYCAILSFAHSRREEMIPEINTRLISVRSKLRRSVVLNTNVIYEFSLKGRWPAERYRNILDLQLQLAYGLSHLFSVVKHLEPSWARALLRRNRFLDSDFQGDILAVISMITSALRTGYPLPQITPCLLDRSMSIYQGFHVIQKEEEEDYGLPRTLNLETLQNEQYLIFCVGVSTSFSIMTKLDRLMVRTKEVVGEQFHIRGVDLAPAVTIRV